MYGTSRIGHITQNAIPNSRRIHKRGQVSQKRDQEKHTLNDKIVFCVDFE